MRVDVYKGGELAATLVYGRDPVYSGTWGKLVKHLVERPHYVRNRWTGDVQKGPPTDSPDWWLSNIYSAGLAHRGFTIFGADVPESGAPFPWGPSPEDTAHGL
jgi:hypothetical protein